MEDDEGCEAAVAIVADEQVEEFGGKAFGQRALAGVVESVAEGEGEAVGLCEVLVLREGEDALGPAARGGEHWERIDSGESTSFILTEWNMNREYRVVLNVN